MHETPDHELLDSFRRGDREAFAVLVARYQGLVRTACQRQAPGSDVEDCAQAVFLVLARRPGAAARAPALAAWLLKVSWYVGRRAQRSAHRRYLAEHQAAHAGKPDENLPAEALGHLDDCLAKLPERQRVAVSMRYLADQPVDNVATALGVNRDNAYQLVSRGLATLRNLLARRGIVVGAPGLLALLTSEGHAATVAGTGLAGAIAPSLSVVPSATAKTLATGVATTMTITSPTLMAASLLLAVGVSTAVLTGEPAPAPAPIPAPSPVQQISVRSSFDDILNQEISIEFQEKSLVDIFSLLHKITGMNMVWPKLTTNQPPLSLKFEKITLRNLLSHIERIAGLTHTIRNEAYVIQLAGATGPQATLDLASADPILLDRMEQRVTFDFQDRSIRDVINFIQQITGINCVVMPAVVAGATSVTLNVRDMQLQNAVHFICERSNTSARYINQALVFDVAPRQVIKTVDTIKRPPETLEDLDLNLHRELSGKN